MNSSLPYKIAVLCFLFNEAGDTLLLHRCKPPNQHLYSPIGGKLEQGIGESPTACAIREIQEEVALEVSAADLHLTGIVSEDSYEGETHWLMFLYELIKPMSVDRTEFDEGRLEWHNPEQIGALPIPETDSQVIWPMFWKYRRQFFTAHIACRSDGLSWQLEQPLDDVSSCIDRV